MCLCGLFASVLRNALGVNRLGSRVSREPVTIWVANTQSGMSHESENIGHFHPMRDAASDFSVCPHHNDNKYCSTSAAGVAMHEVKNA